MENLLAKGTIGIILFGFVVGVFRFFLFNYMNRLREDVKEMDKKIKSEIEKANHNSELLINKYDKINEEFNRLRGYIEGKESNK